MREIGFTLAGFGMIILGSWLFILFPAGGLLIIISAIICLGQAVKTKKRDKPGHYLQRKKKEDEPPQENVPTNKNLDWVWLISIFALAALYVALAIYNNRHLTGLVEQVCIEQPPGMKVKGENS